MKIAISMRNDQAQREPAGRAAVGGSGVVVSGVTSGAAAGTVSSSLGRLGDGWLGKSQFSGGGVVVENFGVAAPLNRGFELAAGFLFAEMFVDQIVEKFVGERAIGFRFQRLFHLAKDRNVGQRGLAKQRFAHLDVGLAKIVASGSDNCGAVFDFDEAENDGGID